MRIFALALAFAPLSTAPAPALAQDRIATADLATVAARGAQLYAFDQAAWHTTDSLLAQKLPDAAMSAIRGWVVEPRGNLLTVTYYGLDADTPYAIYVADFRGGKVVGERVPKTDADRALSATGQRMAAARGVAAGQPPTKCVDRPFNTVVLPPQPDSGVIPVYLLTPMVQDGAYPVGGHHELDIGRDGAIVATRDFSKSCLSIAAQDRAGTKTAAAMFVTHLLDPHPTEIHVYLSLWSGKPIFVGAGDKVWEVAGARVRPTDRKQNPAAPGE
jgi:hypothetical protein